jgi:predicted flap endonuclease-1-like 5' DNA nuclease
MNTCILIHFAVGILSAIFGYLLGRLFGGETCNDCDNYHQKIAHLEAELKACKNQKITTQKRSIASNAASAYVFDRALAKTVFGKTIKENDLTVIEGIGPKIQQLFHKNNIKTWKSLSNCSVAKCQKILDDAGEAYRIHNPGTWPKQARMAYEGKWEKLLKWQDELDGGR